MKAVIADMEHNLCTFQQVCTTFQISIKTCRLHYHKQSIHSDMDKF